LLRSSCLQCHAGAAAASGLDLTTREGMLRGGTRGPALVPGDAAASLIYRAAAHLDSLHMPPKAAKLPSEAIARIAEWIQAGAPYGDAGSSADSRHPPALLERACVPCHNAGRPSSGLDLTTRETLLRGGDRGAAVVPGDPEKSLLYRAISHSGPVRMPYQQARLSDEAIADVAAWIRAGAPYQS